MAPDPVVLVVHHTVSPHLEALLAAVLDGTRAEGIEGVDVVVRPALSASCSDVLAADGVLLGTPANIGYMSGALKHFFDTIYYPCGHATAGMPFGAWVHGNQDLEGAIRSIQTVTTGLKWRRVIDDVRVVGTPTKDDLEACFELGATVALTVAERHGANARGGASS